MRARKAEISIVESLADEFFELDAQRQQLDRSARAIRRRLDGLREKIQDFIGKGDQLDVPYVSNVGHFQITQTLKHRDVDAFSYDFVEFKVVKG